MTKLQLMILTAGLAISTVGASGATNPCPSTGNAQYCNEIIFISSTGAVTVDTTAGSTLVDGVTVNISSTPYDGDEDQLIGVIDLDTLGTVNNLGLTGSSITDFDGDGANAGGTACVTTKIIGTLYGCNGTANTLDQSHGNTGYAGFDSNGTDNYFTSFTNPGNSATLNFSGGLTNGQTAWFSLEEPATAGGLGVTVNSPEPMSFVLLGTLLGLVGLTTRRKRIQ